MVNPFTVQQINPCLICSNKNCFVILLPNVFAAETMWVPVLEGLLLYINS